MDGGRGLGGSQQTDRSGMKRKGFGEDPLQIPESVGHVVLATTKTAWEVEKVVGRVIDVGPGVIVVVSDWSEPPRINPIEPAWMRLSSAEGLKLLRAIEEVHHRGIVVRPARNLIP
jgi:hypothetical protein